MNYPSFLKYSCTKIGCIVLTISLNCIINSYSQGLYQFSRYDSVPVSYNAISLKNAWAGGINFAQVYNIDLDYDGIQDIVVFDRSGNKILPFLQKAQSPLSHFQFAPQYKSHFPNSLRDWIIIKDYNQDGLADIFSYSSGACSVYLNTGNSSTGLQFQLKKQMLYSFTGLITQSIFITSDDIPGIEDIDGDGDLDLLTFNNLGRCVQYHQNQSQELYGHSDSLIFKLKSDNWGNFSEGITSNTIILNDSCDLKSSNDGASSFLLYDFNNDGKMDCVLGDQNYNNLILLTNTGTNTWANISQIDYAFPSNNTSTSPINLTVFPAGFMTDINNDGVKDLIVSPQGVNRSENKNSVYSYLNSGSNSLPNLQFTQQNFIQETMLDFGEGAYPAFLDYDQDGLLDLVVSNYGYFVNTNHYQSKMALFKNTGTATSPAFTLINDNYANLSNSSILGTRPTFGDIDGDGDVDMIIGEKNGKIHLYKNISTPGQVAQFIIDQPNFMNIQTQQFSTPFLFDMNEDGKLDLLMGNIRGWVDYYENKGSAQSPMFTTSPTIAKIGGINVIDSTLSLNGYSCPWAIMDGNDIHIMVGSYSGKISHYRNVRYNLQGVFDKFTGELGSIQKEGLRTAPAIAYLDGDNKWELIIGNYSGGISLYKGEVFNTGEENYSLENKLKIYPNPTSDFMTLEIPTSLEGIITIYDVLGRKVYEEKRPSSEKFLINTSNLKDGSYILKWVSSNKYQASSILFIVNH